MIHGTGFYWWPLERGPIIWRATLAKPVSHIPSVADVMSADHFRLLELWSDLKRAAELCQFDTIHRRSVELSVGLRRYIDIEEVLLFPVLEGQTQMSVGRFTARMRTEHREIGRIVEELDKRRTATDCPAILEIFERPFAAMDLFQQHCRREEAGIYPFMKMAFNRAEERELLSLLQEFEI
jgi:hemerythrin-like domain-containing protein